MKPIIFIIFYLLLPSCSNHTDFLIVGNSTIHLNQLSEAYLEHRPFIGYRGSIPPSKKFSNQQVQTLMKILSKGNYNKNAILVHTQPAYGTLISYIILVTYQGEKIEIELSHILSSSDEANCIVLPEREKNELIGLIKTVNQNGINNEYK